MGEIYGSDSSGTYGNEILGDGNASYIEVGDGDNTALLGNFYAHATDPSGGIVSGVIEGGTGHQTLVGMGSGAETLVGGAAGADTSAVTFIDGGGADALLVGGGQNSFLFGGTGADTLVASSGSGTSASDFNPTTVAMAGLSFWGDAYSSRSGQDDHAYDVTALPGVAASLDSPEDVQVTLSLFQSDGTFGAPVDLLGSSMDSGTSGGAALPGSVLIGGTGQDWLIGNNSDDLIEMGTGSALIEGRTARRHRTCTTEHARPRPRERHSGTRRRCRGRLDVQRKKTKWDLAIDGISYGA